LQSLEVHVNLLKTAPLATYLCTVNNASTTGRFLKSNQNPLLGTRITVTKFGPYKGYNAVIKNVLPGQGASSKMRFDIQFEHLDPSNPFKTITVNYDEVAESE
jgi:hypothetical protein